MGEFRATVSDWAQKELQRLEAVLRTAAEMVVNEVSEPGPSVATTKKAISKGIGSGRGKAKRQGPVLNTGGAGRLPVDTGNLRRSLLVSTASMPQVDKEPKKYTAQDVDLVIQGAELGGTIFIGFQASYGPRMEYGFVGTDAAGRTYNQPGYGFVSATAQPWPQIIQEAEARVRSRFDAGH